MVLSLVIDIAKKIADKCVNPIVEYIGTEGGHLLNYSANLKKLEEEVGHLNDATRRMVDRIEDAGNRSGETRVDAGAERWLTKMARLSDEASRIIKEEERETGRCLMGLRPNLLACYRASKSAKKVMDSADELKKDGVSITTVAHVDYSQSLGFAINPYFEELESRKEASEEIVAYLKDPSVKMVGMYGMGGTGKTTLAEKIGVQLYEDGTFRYVVKTVVSNNQKTDLTQIQKQIADQLKISFKNDKDDVKARATRLREQLEKMDKVLIILDDIWSKFELREVGIPLDRELKVLITSRDVNVMNEMDSKHNVPLGDLSSEDSWKLFDRMADGVAPDSDRYSTARDVVEQCGGIPVLLVTIARALRNKEDLETWKEALFQLKNFEGDNFVEDGYKRLAVSFNFLPNYELRSLFLLCAQLDHRSIPIEDLLRYTMGLGLFDKRKKLCQVRSRLHMHLSHLKGYCLLQDGNGKGTVRMHDVVHKFAAFIAYRDRSMFSTVAQDQLEEWPSKDELEQFSAISLPYCHLPPPDHQLPVAFDSSKLESFLFLRHMYEDPLDVPDEFFIGMKELKLVDIRRMYVSPVWTSLNVLGKLRTLCLDYCALDDIDVIGDLPMLQVLSLKGSTVSEIRSLGSSLKLLDLSDCGRLEVIASGVFCNLTLLEDLRLGKSFDKWEPLQGCNSGSDHETSTTKKLASLREFKNLGNLINLDIDIPDPKTFPKDLVFAKLERFNVVIGDLYYFRYEIDSETLKVKLAEDIQLFEGIKVLMRKAKELHLEKIQGVTSVSELLFPNLTSIRVSSCNVLKYLLSSHLALRGLSCLKEIRVEDCKSMESIVSRESENRITGEDQLDDEEEEIMEFIQLRILELRNLDRFISFYPSSTLNPIIFSSQKRQKQDSLRSTDNKIVEENHRLPISLFNEKVLLFKLEDLQLESLRVDQIWDHAQKINSWFPNLTILKVYYCNNLSYLFTSSMVKRLAQLKELQVWSCKSILEIVATKGEMAEDEEEIIEFTQLRKLELIGLRRLISFYSGSTPNPIISSSQERQDSTSSSENEIVEENQWLPTSLFNKKVVLPKLEELKLFEMNVDRIWDDQLAIDAQTINCWFQNLTILRVYSYHNLSYLFTSSMIRSLAQLKKLEVFSCKSILKIVATKGEMAGDEKEIIEFTQLRMLTLKYLDGLISFYSSSTSNSTISSSQERPEHERLPTSLFNKKVVFPNLEEVKIRGLHKVEMIWENQLHLNLRYVTVSLCRSLTSIFPASVAMALKQLESLSIIDCESLKEIVSKEEEEDGGPTFVFPKLTSLYLEWLPELERVYSGPDILDWPSLSHLHVDCCYKLIDPSNLNIKKLDALFAKIISLSLESCSLEGTNFEVRYSSLSGEIRLIGLSKMKHFWSERYADDQFDWIPLNLKNLEVESCGSLMSLAPKSALFQNLTRLVVRGCNELIKLVASSTVAKRLVNLTEIRVSECDSLKEIVAIYDDHDGEEASSNSTEDIVFGKLKTLVLESLRSLTSFTTNNCNFQFPSLEQVTVAECPNMEFFSRGVLSTPKLSGVWIEEERKMWESDLNSTVRQLYRAMNSTN